MHGLAVSWESKVIGLHATLLGFGKSGTFNKFAVRLHYVMSLYSVIFISLGTYGLYNKISSGHFTLVEVAHPFQFLVIFSGNLVGFYSFVHQRHRVSACMMDLSGTLRCLSRKEEARTRQKHRKRLKFFILGFMMIYCELGVTIVASLAARFGLMSSSWYVALPVWYSVDMHASSIRFWAAFTGETIMFSYWCFFFVSFILLFLYAATVVTVRLEVLGGYLKQLTNPQIRTRLRDELFVESDTENGSKWLNYSSVSIAETTDTNSKRLKDGLKDLHILQRQKKCINKAFTLHLTWMHTTVLIVNAIMPFAAAYEVRSERRVNENALLFLFYTLGCIWSAFFVSYMTTILQDSLDNLLHALWECEWFAKGGQFKNLFLLSGKALKQSFTLKVYSFYPINLNTLATSLVSSWNVLIFLYQVSGRK